MIPRPAWIVEPDTSQFDIVLRSLDVTAKRCTNSTANSTLTNTTNATCVHGTCTEVVDQNISIFQCACNAGFTGSFCESPAMKTNNSNNVGLVIFLLLILSIILIFCGSVVRVVIKRRVERKRVVSATAALDLEDEIYVV